MADPAIQSASAVVFGGVANPVAFGSANTAGNTIAACVWSTDNSPVSVSDTRGNSYTATTAFQDPSTLKWVRIFYALGIAAGANTVTSAAISGGDGITMSIVKLPACSGLRVQNQSSGTASAPSVSLTGTTSGDVCVLLVNANDGSTQTAGSCGTNSSYVKSSAFPDVATLDGFSSGGSVSISTGGPSAAAWSATAIALIPGSVGPNITGQPASTQVASGATASFSVTATASGGGTLSYQWKINATNVSTGSGGTTSSYTTAALAYTDDLGSYTCAVTETGGTNAGTTTSSPALVYVGTRNLGANTPVYSTSGGTSVAPSYSTLPTIQAGDEIILIVAQKPSTANSGTVTTPTGYTLIDSLTGAGGYSTTLGSGTGNTNTFVYRKTTPATGSESGTLSVTVGTNNVCSATFVLLRPIAGSTISYASATGSDTTSGNVSITAGSDPGEVAGDVVLLAFNGASNAATYSAEAVTTTGITYSSVTELAEPTTATGNQIAGFIASAKALSGTSSAAPVFTATTGGTTTNARGPGVVLRMRATGTSASAPSTSRSQARSGATQTYVTAAPAIARTQARSGASVDSTGSVSAPSATRSAARAFAAVCVASDISSPSRSPLSPCASSVTAVSISIGGPGDCVSGATLSSAVIAATPARSQATSGATQTTAGAAAQPSRSLANSGASVDSTATASVPSTTRSLATSGAAVDTTGDAPAATRSAANSGAVSLNPSALGQPIRSLAKSGAPLESPTVAPGLSRSLSSSGAAAALLLAACSAVRSQASSGASVDSTGSVSVPSASRSLARSGATVSDTGTVCSSTRSLATSGASVDTTGSTSAPSTTRSLARSSAPVLTVGAVCAASRGLGSSCAAVAAAALVCSSSRSLASSGASVDTTLSTSSPSASRSLARSSAAQVALGTVCSPSRSMAVSSASVDFSGSISAPSVTRSLASSGATTTTALTACTSVRSLERSGASKTFDPSGAPVASLLFCSPLFDLGDAPFTSPLLVLK